MCLGNKDKRPAYTKGIGYKFFMVRPLRKKVTPLCHNFNYGNIDDMVGKTFVDLPNRNGFYVYKNRPESCYNWSTQALFKVRFSRVTGTGYSDGNRVICARTIEILEQLPLPSRH